MLYGAQGGGLEVRRMGDGARVIAGRFPYRIPAMLSDRPQARREVFEGRAFADGIDAGGNVHLLLGHDYTRPLASRTAGTLSLTDTEDALAFEARIGREIAETTHGRDALAMIGAGLAVGLSPGFRVPEGGEAVTAAGGGILRTITRADLFELSIVTRPAYDAAQVEARNWVQVAAALPLRLRSGRAYAWR